MTILRPSALILSGLLSVLALGIAFSSTASAIESSGVGILPANPRADTPRSSSIFIYTTPAGSTKTDAVTVFNNSDKTQTLALYATDSQTSSDGAFACAQQVEVARRVGAWVKLDTSTITLEAGESAKVPFTITIPASTEVGEHNGCMAVQVADQSPEADKNGISLSFRSALRIAITIPGDLSANIKFLDTHYKALNSTTSHLSATVRNDGTVSTDTSFNVSLIGLWGKHQFSSAAGTYPIFPKTDSTFNFELPSPFWGGWYRTAMSASYYPPSDSGKPASTAVTVDADKLTVFIAPQPLALLIESLFLLALVGFITAIALRRHYQKLAVKQARGHTAEAGETITSVADHYQVNWRRIAALNQLKAPYNLTANQQLIIPHSRTHKPTTPSAKK